MHNCSSRSSRPDSPVRFLLLFALFTILPQILAGQSENAGIAYSVSIPDPVAEEFIVVADLTGITPDTLLFHFPVWGPGAYDIVNFGGFVSDLSATDPSGTSLGITRRDSATWMLPRPPARFRITYRVHDIEELDNSPFFGLSDIEDSTRLAFANAPALFGYPEGFKEIPYRVTFTPPPGWDLAVALDPVDTAGDSRTFAAANYDELVDAPVQMGVFQKWMFEVNGVPHTITYSGPVPLSEKSGENLVTATRNVVIVFSQFFGEMPYDRYLFQYYLIRPTSGQTGFGALEHANSSTYLMPYYGDAYVAPVLLPVIAHEYWHLWSPKRFHVSSLGPFDYQKPPATNSLWFHEGITDYYAHLLLLRNKLLPPSYFFETFRGHIEMFYDQEQAEPITKLSRELPYRKLDDIIGLYTKGPLLALMLDGEIRVQSDGRFSLDDVMRHFNEHYGDHRGGKRFDDDDIVGIIEEVTGVELDDFYRRFIDGTEPLPIDSALGRIGLMVTHELVLGARTTSQSDGIFVNYVNRRGTMGETGVKKGDLITSFVVNGTSIKAATLGTGSDSDSLESWLSVRATDPITVRINRGSEELELGLNPQWVIPSFGPDPNASIVARAIRKSMLGL